MRPLPQRRNFAEPSCQELALTLDTQDFHHTSARRGSNGLLQADRFFVSY
jgi:hypothetical protein